MKRHNWTLGSLLKLLVGLLITSQYSMVRADTAIFAGGCFWCVEALYQEVPGVTTVVSGFTGGTLPNPTYNGNHQGHYEAVEVTYDAGQISYQQLLEIHLSRYQHE